MGSPWLEAGPNEAVPNSTCGLGTIGLLFNDETIPEAIWLTSRTDDAKQMTYLMLNPLSPDFCSASWSSPEDLTTHEDVSKPPPPRTLLPCTGVFAAKAFGLFLPVLSNSGTHYQGPGKKLTLIRGEENRRPKPSSRSSEAKLRGRQRNEAIALGTLGRWLSTPAGRGFASLEELGLVPPWWWWWRRGRGKVHSRGKVRSPTCKDGNGSLVVKCCKEENAQQVAAPDKWSKTRLQGATPAHLVYSSAL